MRSLRRAVVLGGLLGGTLDLLFAVTFAGMNGAAPTRVFATIASGWLGSAAYDGGAGTWALGIASHYGLSILWAAIFALAATRVPKLVTRPVLVGIGFGIVVFFSMRLVVLPLSAYPRPVAFPPLSTALDLLSHMWLFGVPIAVFVARALRARASSP